MQDEQKQIEEMAYSICTANRELIKSCRECPIFQGDKYSCVKKEFAEKFYNAGCRMQSNTVREIVERLYKQTHNYYPSIDHYCLSKRVILVKDLEELVAEYGMKVKHD